MVSLGCTICRGCQLDTCHVGIATQIETTAEATEHGLKKFTCRRSAPPTSCARFSEMGEEVRRLTAELGYEHTQELVGRYDLLEQIAHRDRIDLTELITPLEEYLDLEPIDMPVADEELVEARAEAGLVRARPIRMQPKQQASAQIAELSDRVGQSPGCGSSSRGRPTPTTACSVPSSPGRSPRPDLRGRPRGVVGHARRARPTAARSPGRVRRLQCLGLVVRVEAAPRTASARRCLAGPFRS